MRPVHRAELATVPRIGSGLDESGPADFVIPPRGQRGDDQLAPVIVDEVPIAIAHDESGSPASLLLSHIQSLPHALSGLQVQAAELSVAADAIDIVTVDHRSVDYGMQTIGVDLAVALSLPKHSGFRSSQLDQHGAVVKGR